MIRSIFTTALIICSYCAFGCSCSINSSNERNVQEAYKFSSNVILGYVLDVGRDQAKVEVIEPLKGNDLMDTIFIKRTNSCWLYVEEGEMWLLYLEPLESDMYEANRCLPNRHFRKMNILSFPPPLIDSGMTETYYLKSVLLYQELISLRQKKLLNKDEEKQIELCRGCGLAWIVILGIFVNSILLVLIFFKYKRSS